MDFGLTKLLNAAEEDSDLSAFSTEESLSPKKPPPLTFFSVQGPKQLERSTFPWRTIPKRYDQMKNNISRGELQSTEFSFDEIVSKEAGRYEVCCDAAYRRH